MPRYRVRFTETVEYEVEFESDKTLDELRSKNQPDTDDGCAWFEAMDHARPDWPTAADEMAVHERSLGDIEIIDDAAPAEPGARSPKG